MKQIFILLTFIISTTMIAKIGNAQNTREAVIYMNDLTEPIIGLKSETWKYLKVVTKGRGARVVEKKREKLIKQTKLAKIATQKKKAFEGDDSLKLAIINYLDLTYSVLKEDFDKIVDMEEIAEQSYDDMEAYMMAKEKANDKLDQASEIMRNAQDQFAEKHGITLSEETDDKTIKKIEKASKALKYYNQIYLIFFKVYKQEIYVLDALRNSDVNALEQNTTALATLADEALEKLKEIEPFEGDQTLIRATKEILLFYKREATTDFPKYVDFFIKKDNFEKIKKTVEAKSERQRTKQDIAQYNKAMNEYNKAVADFNKVNELVNKNREKYFKIWNTKIETFFERHA